jgi:hypothetical protein
MLSALIMGGWSKLPRFGFVVFDPFYKSVK